MCVQEAPEFELKAIPQLVPTQTRMLPGVPVGRDRHTVRRGLGRAAGIGVAGFAHVAPPSVERQMPPPLVCRPS